MSIEKESELKTGGAIILNGDEMRMLECFAMTMESMAKAIREMIGDCPANPLEKL